MIPAARTEVWPEIALRLIASRSPTVLASPVDHIDVKSAADLALKPAQSHYVRSMTEQVNGALTNERPSESETILLALHSENGEIARTMVEWRHKLILLFVATLGAVATSAIWLSEHKMRASLRWELVAGSAVMFLFVLMEHRTTLILHDCYRVGSEIEDSFVGNQKGIYSALHISQNNAITYSNLLRLAYLITSVTLAVFAFLVSS